MLCGFLRVLLVCTNATPSRGSAKVSGPRIRVTIPPYTEVFERGYPPREAVPTFFQKEMGWVVREDSRGCHFLHKVWGETCVCVFCSVGRLIATAMLRMILTVIS